MRLRTGDTNLPTTRISHEAALSVLSTGRALGAPSSGGTQFRIRQNTAIFVSISVSERLPSTFRTATPQIFFWLHPCDSAAKVIFSLPALELRGDHRPIDRVLGRFAWLRRPYSHGFTGRKELNLLTLRAPMVPAMTGNVSPMRPLRS